MGERVAIVGSRDYPHPAHVQRAVSGLASDDIVISGGARGVDSMAAKFARWRGLEVVEHLADWEHLGKRAGYVRNITIVEDCDRVIAFQHNASRGTQHTIDIARKAGKPVEVHTSEGAP